MSGVLVLQLSGVLALFGLVPGPSAVVMVSTLVSLEVVLLVLFLGRAGERARRHRLLNDLGAEVNRAILLNEDEDKIFATILDYGFQIFDNINDGSVLAFDETGDLVVVASRGFEPRYVAGFRIRLEETFQYRQSAGRMDDALIIDPSLIRQYEAILDFRHRRYQSIISAPLYVDGKLYGLLNVDSTRPKAFGQADLEVLRRFRAQIEVSLLARQRYQLSLNVARHDSLTGFLSRSYFEELFRHSVQQSLRYGEKFVLGIFDADGLKEVNDTLGHLAGDLLLKAVADSLRRLVRQSDVVCRYGGDEFVALCRHTDARAMESRVGAVLEDLSRAELQFNGRPFQTSFSYGFADCPGDGTTLEELVAHADSRLYRMKSERRSLRRASLEL